MTVFGALRASPPSSTTVATASIWAWFFLFHVVLRCWCGDAFYTDTLLQNRRRYAQQPLHRAAFIRTCSCADRFVHREAFTDRRIYTEVFTQRSFYTQKLLHTDALYKDAFAQRSICEQITHRRFYSQTLSHTQKLLHRETFAQNSFYMKKFSSPPCSKKNRQTGIGIWAWIFFVSCRFPSR